MSAPPVLVAIEGRVGRLTLNRPNALHTLSTEMCLTIADALLSWRSNDAIKAVLVDHAEGTRGFCAGGDVRMLVDSVAGDGRSADAFFTAEYRLNALIKSYPKPYISIMDGVTMGGGVGLVVHGSHRIATENTLLAMPEVGIGFFPDVGGGWFLPRLPGAIGMWLALTGTVLRGRDVLAAGIATHFIEHEQLPRLKYAIASSGARAVDALTTTTAPSFAPHIETIASCFAGETIDDILGKLGQGHSAWAAQQLATIARQSPLSLKVAFRQLRCGARHGCFAETMRMDFRIAHRMVRSHDFREGVRATVIDKDRAPRWEPSELAEVTDDMLERIFTPLDSGELVLIDEEEKT